MGLLGEWYCGMHGVDACARGIDVLSSYHFIKTNQSTMTITEATTALIITRDESTLSLLGIRPAT